MMVYSMKPTMIDKIVNNSGDTVRETEKTEYKRLMTRNEANILGKLMKNVVENGTASALNGRGYTVAGKTGSAEFDENGSSHSWFIGYSNVDDPDLVVAVIVENGGSGSEAAVPIAGQILMLITPANSNLYDIPCCQFSEKEVYYIQFRKHTHYRRIAI